MIFYIVKNNKNLKIQLFYLFTILFNYLTSINIYVYKSYIKFNLNINWNF